METKDVTEPLQPMILGPSEFRTAIGVNHFGDPELGNPVLVDCFSNNLLVLGWNRDKLDETCGRAYTREAVLHSAGRGNRSKGHKVDCNRVIWMRSDLSDYRVPWNLHPAVPLDLDAHRTMEDVARYVWAHSFPPEVSDDLLSGPVDPNVSPCQLMVVILPYNGALELPGNQKLRAIPSPLNEGLDEPI